jgi:hypothetical protein
LEKLDVPVIESKVHPGIYRHYKGEYCFIIGVAQHTEIDERLVLYVPLTGNENKAGLRLRARPLTGEKGFLTPEEGRIRFQSGNA